MAFCPEHRKWDHNLLKIYIPKQDDKHPCPIHMGVLPPPGQHGQVTYARRWISTLSPRLQISLRPQAGVVFSSNPTPLPSAGWELPYGGIFLYAQTWMISLWIIGLALHPENCKKDQNLHFLPLSETNSTPVTFTWEASPELSSSDILVNSVMLCLQSAEILTCFLSVLFSVPFASHNVV